mmetsp:Transcript_102809/g.296019  ORF Transcript_102809/g.296019 Transcript_102809/m.296019 type:complete len:513 (+) Transcript_102809:123-1661(+)
MQSEFFTAGSKLMVFCMHPGRSSKSPKINREVHQYNQTLIRLLSFLHATCMMHVSLPKGSKDEDKFRPEVLDIQGLGYETIRRVAEEECKAELIVQWIQGLTVEAISSKLLDAPATLLSGIFQNFSNGLGALSAAARIRDVQYPFPYFQTTEILLVFHWVLTPFIMVQFSRSAPIAGLFTFITVFTMLSLHFIAVEIEDPFGMAANDLDLLDMQVEMNKRLLMLCRESGMPLPRTSDLAVGLGDGADAPVAHICQRGSRPRRTTGNSSARSSVSFDVSRVPINRLSFERQPATGSGRPPVPQKRMSRASGASKTSNSDFSAAVVAMSVAGAADGCATGLVETYDIMRTITEEPSMMSTMSSMSIAPKGDAHAGQRPAVPGIQEEGVAAEPNEPKLEGAEVAVLTSDDCELRNSNATLGGEERGDAQEPPAGPAKLVRKDSAAQAMVGTTSSDAIAGSTSEPQVGGKVKKKRTSPGTASAMSMKSKSSLGLGEKAVRSKPSEKLDKSTLFTTP